MDKTTIQVKSTTLDRLKAMKRHSRESYDEMLNHMIDEIEDDELSDEEIEEIKLALEEIKRGETISIEDFAEEVGVSLE